MKRSRGGMRDRPFLRVVEPALVAAGCVNPARRGAEKLKKGELIAFHVDHDITSKDKTPIRP